MANNQEIEVELMKATVWNQETLLRSLHTKARYQYNGIRTLQSIGDIRRLEISELQNILKKDELELKSLRDTFNCQRSEIDALRNLTDEQQLELTSKPTTFKSLLHENATMRLTIEDQKSELSKQGARVELVRKCLFSTQGDNAILRFRAEILVAKKTEADATCRLYRDLSAKNETKFTRLETINNRLEKSNQRLTQQAEHAHRELKGRQKSKSKKVKRSKRARIQREIASEVSEED